MSQSPDIESVGLKQICKKTWNGVVWHFKQGFAVAAAFCVLIVLVLAWIIFLAFCARNQIPLGGTLRSTFEGVSVKYWKNAEQVNYLAATIAIVVGGASAYFKYIAGQVFRFRLEPSLVAVVEKRNNRKFLVVQVQVKNVGTSSAVLDDARYLCLYCGVLENFRSEPKAVRWFEKPSFRQRVFPTDLWIRSGETVAEEILIELPDSVSHPEIQQDSVRFPPFAWRAYFCVNVKRGFFRWDDEAWWATKVVIVQEESQHKYEKPKPSNKKYRHVI